MKWRCPICQKENQNKWKCDCGFDESKNYEKYKVILSLNKEKIQNYIGQKSNPNSLYEMYIKSINNAPIQYLQQAAELGDLRAQYELGRLYYDEIVGQDTNKAFDWWQHAIEEDKNNILSNKLGLKYMMQSKKLERIEKELEKSKEKINELQTQIKEIRTGQTNDVIKFGKNNREWIVLDRQKNKVLIITKDIVEERVYNEKWESIRWENCTLRRWLNGEFLQQNFSIEEQNRIVNAVVKNPEYGPNRRMRRDKIFCLSIEEARNYFKDNKARAVGSQWWLRSLGNNSSRAAIVFADGSINQDGSSVGLFRSVRPALWLNLES